jgi:hypothetical protein
METDITVASGQLSVVSDQKKHVGQAIKEANLSDTLPEAATPSTKTDN